MQKIARALSLFLYLSLAICSTLAQGQSKPILTEDNAPIVNSEADEGHLKADPQALEPPQGSIPSPFAVINQSDFISDFFFAVDKTARTLSVWKKKGKILKLVEYHPIDKGKSEGDKQRLGDLKTPEGIYFFQNTHTQPYLDFKEYGQRAFTMDYPNFFDRFERKTGSGIWLHAIPDSKSLWRGSRGCVVVRNSIISKLQKYIQFKKTPIIIADKINFLSKDQYVKNREEWLAWLEDWKSAWSKKDLNSYIQFYSDSFQWKGMNKEQYERYKANLNKRYQFIDVNIENPVILTNDDHAIIHFIQDYKSDKVSDQGQKTLHLVRTEDNNYKIISESWKAFKRPLMAKEDATDSSTY